MLRNIIIFVFAGFFLVSCSQLTIFQTAETEGKGNLTISPAIEGLSFNDSSAGGGEIGRATLPGARVEFAYGITDNLDLSASISSSASLLTSIKYRFLGYPGSTTSMALMPGYEYQVSANSGETYTSRFHLPLLMSYNTSDNMGLFFGPKYVIQVAERGNNFSYGGISAGISINRNIQYIIGGGVFLPWNYQTGIEGTIYQLGVSARIPLIKK